jgi:hypothetical protein
MEQNQKNISQTQSAKADQQDLTEYRVYEHPLLPRKIVKIGFCWPAVLVGPIFLVYRKLWVSVTVWIGAIVIVQYALYTSFQICYTDGTSCSISFEDRQTLELYREGAVFVCLLLLGFLTNDLWTKDLLNRGYIVTKSLRARSMDDALAIIEREKLSPSTSNLENNNNQSTPKNAHATNTDISTMINDKHESRPLTFLDFALAIFLFTLITIIIIAARK